MSEVSERYRAIAEGFTVRLRGVGADGWTAATPCTDWTVKDLVGHVVDTHRRILSTVRGNEPATVAVDADLVGEWSSARDAIAAAVDDPPTAATVISGMFGEQPFESLVGRLLCTDTLVHTWDLARATGQDEHLDAVLASSSLEFLGPIDDAIRRPGGFAAKIAPAPDADAATQLLNFCGSRRLAEQVPVPGPFWHPSHVAASRQRTAPAEPVGRRPGRPPRTEEQRASQRARLLEATMAAIRRDGPELTIDALALAAGVSKPVLYGEFGDKLGLADAMAVSLAERVEHDILKQVAVGRDFDVDQAVRVAVTVIINLIVDEPNMYAFLVRSMRANDRGFLDNALVRQIHDRAAVLMRLIVPELDRATLTLLTDGLFGFVFGAVESWQATRRPSKARLIDGLTAVIVNGWRAAATGF